MTYLIEFIILFVVIFLLDYLLINRKYLNRINGKSKRKRKKNTNELTELSYLVKKFNLDRNKLPLNKLMIIIAIINAFIISLTGEVVLLIDVNIIIQLLIGFILLLALIYSLYELLGRHLVKKGFEKDGN